MKDLQRVEVNKKFILQFNIVAMSKKLITPSFFRDYSEGDVTKEAVVDFFLSWTIRCAAIDCDDVELDETERDKLQKVKELSRRFVLMLIFAESEKDYASIEDTCKDYEVEYVKTWKQWSQIDLIAHVDLKYKGNDKKEDKHYAIIIEDKVYSKSHSNQLSNYMGLMEKYYKNLYHDKEQEKDISYETRYIYMTCHDSVPEEDVKKCKEACVESGDKCYKYWTLGGIQSYFGKFLDDVPYTGHELFDEFWFRY